MILRWLEETKRSGGFSNASKKSLNDFRQVIFFSHKFVKLF
jgi:hypothetical protein